jgi:hypothetical protein
VRLRALLAVLAVPFVMIVTAPAALACSCAVQSFGEQLGRVGVAFTGTAVAVADDATGPVLSSVDPLRWTFAVSRVYRGAPGARQVVTTARSDASCGAGFQVGREYLVLGSGDPVEANLCNGTRAVVAGEPVHAELGAGRLPPAAPAALPATPPVDPSASATPAAISGAPSSPLIAVTIGLAAVALAGFAVRRHKTTRRNG